MSFNRGQKLIEALELIEPYLTFQEMESIRVNTGIGEQLDKSGDGAWRVINQWMTITLFERKKKKYEANKL